ncbi:unnamed protein product [Clonostachys byssicola]|uniref:Uncharacterized protein n=1 Tax=Clonostachys byssicola TaxID=160290 RepID=A0A9N9Y830_9HYPO|nr:unnamed protein product [Clonostachys byssicola]
MRFVQNFLALGTLFAFGLTEACAGAKPAINSDYTITVNLFGDNTCCSGAFGKTVMGNLGTCHTASQPFGSITEAVGQGMFGRSIKVLAYPDSSCSSSSYVYWDISNKVECFWSNFPDSYRSFKIQVILAIPDPKLTQYQSTAKELQSAENEEESAIPNAHQLPASA